MLQFDTKSNYSISQKRVPLCKCQVQMNKGDTTIIVCSVPPLAPSSGRCYNYFLSQIVTSPWGLGVRHCSIFLLMMAPPWFHELTDICLTIELAGHHIYLNLGTRFPSIVIMLSARATILYHQLCDIIFVHMPHPALLSWIRASRII